MATPPEIAAMRRAVALSAFGLGRTSPNPPVGCVILDEHGVAVGEGYHQRKGEPHAETNALAAAGRKAEGGTAVVTLEPCNHSGRTPACRQALLNAGIRRVVIAVIDPTSRGEGGAAVLRAAGVDVEIGVLEDEARQVLGGWLAALSTGRPVVVWPVLLDGPEIRALPPDLLSAEIGRQAADVTLSPGGRVQEAEPNSHGAGILDLADISPGTPPGPALAELYASGVRTLLLNGGRAPGEDFTAAGFVDRLIAYLHPARTSAPGPPLVQPVGFVVVGIERAGARVRIESAPSSTDRPRFVPSAG